jgi:cytochrome c553
MSSVVRALGIALTLCSLFVPSVRPQAAERAPAVPDTLAQRLQPCTLCHGREGRATNAGYFPRIAGKPAGYLFAQLVNFRDGRRHNPTMTALVDLMPDDTLREIAGHFAALDLPYPPPRPADADAALRERGRVLVREGDAARGLPACADCHGAAMMGVAPAIPGLLGLPRDYLLGQFGAWRNGQRRAAPPDCMRRIAEQLDAQDIRALASWLSAQPVPPGAKPDDRPRATLPIDCGSTTGAAAQGVVASTGAASSAASPAAAVPAGASSAASTAASSPDSSPASSPTSSLAASPALIERGAYLARAGDCAACHTERGGAPYAGGRGIDTPFGTVYASNLTPDPGTGLGRWSADDFWQALHHGRSRDGRLLVPAFPYTATTRVTREDADALFAYLRSLPAVAKPNRAHALRFPFDTQAAIAAWRALFFRPGVFEPDPKQSAAWNRGAYLVTGLGHCAACHAPRNLLGATRDAPALGGGPMPQARWYAPSLAAAAEGGVADWPAQDVVALLRDGRTARGTALGPMAEVVFRSTQHLSAEDLAAVATYLKALPASPAASAPARVAHPAVNARGAQLYRDHCASCHGEQGEGAAGVYAPLAGRRTVTMASPANAIRMVIAGGFPPATAGNPRPYGMPPFGQVLGDEDIEAVVSYIRQAWGNAAPAVTLSDVQRAR